MRKIDPPPSGEGDAAGQAAGLDGAVPGAAGAAGSGVPGQPPTPAAATTTTTTSSILSSGPLALAGEKMGAVVTPVKKYLGGPMAGVLGGGGGGAAAAAAAAPVPAAPAPYRYCMPTHAVYTFPAPTARISLFICCQSL